jgi:uncharacterized protein (DUF2164 family)
VAIQIEAERKNKLMLKLQQFYQAEFDEPLSAFRAAQIVDFIARELGPQIYNQAVQDARKFMQERLDDMDGEVREVEGK